MCEVMMLNRCDADKAPEDEDENKLWTPFMRQLLVCSGVLTVFFLLGVSFGAPTVLIQQLRDEGNSTEAVSVAAASWLSSTFGYASLPWIFVLTALIHYIGRRKTFLLVACSTIVSFVCFYFSNTTTQLIITAAVLGMSHAASFTVSITVLAEFTSPEYRGVFLTMKTASVFWGIWCSNAIGTFLHWKCIPLFGIICSLFPLTALCWPESPYWLASKGRIDECRISHRWLKGTGRKAEEELRKLTMEKIEVYRLGSPRDMRSRQFYMPTLICCLMIMQFYASGKFVCSVYSLEILKKMTATEYAAYATMLVLDAVTIISAYAGCVLTSYIKRRTQLFVPSAIGLLFIFGLSLYLYLIELKAVGQNNVLTITILIIFSVSISCGPGIMSVSIMGELIPMKFKNLCSIIISVWFQVLNSTLLKIFPYINIAFGLHGTFLCYGIAMLVLTLVLYKLLPETKGKTLHEIERLWNKER